MPNKKDIVRKIEYSVYGFLKTGKIRSILVAVSGGADSVALLCACSRIAPRLGLRVEAANCNFHLRGAESDRDSSFTADLCRRLDIRLHKLDYDVDAYLKQYPGASTEMACRELRYADFFRIAKERNLESIAVAHNSDDDIETMLLNMLRGSGSRGLRGMEKDNGKVIRPLLGIPRLEIEGYLNAIEQNFITDSSNLTNDYRRNFLRRDVLPLLESRWNGSRKSLSKTLSIMKEESEIVESFYKQQLLSLSPDPTTLLVYVEGVRAGTVLRFMEPFGGNAAIAEDIMESLGKQHKGRRWELSPKHDAVLERDRLIIVDKDAYQLVPSLIWTKLDMTHTMMAEIKNNRSHDTVYLPHDESAYELRLPRKGDRIAPLGMKGTRLVSDIISDAHLDSQAKASVYVLARHSDGEIIWVTGLKRSRHELVCPSDAQTYKVALNIEKPS